MKEFSTIASFGIDKEKNAKEDTKKSEFIKLICSDCGIEFDYDIIKLPQLQFNRKDYFMYYTHSGKSFYCECGGTNVKLTGYV